MLLPLLPLDLRNIIPRGNTSVVGRSAVIRENWSNGEHSSPAGEANNSAICGGREGETAGKEGKSVYPGFWDTFGAWYCGNDGWKVNLVRLEEKFSADPFRGTMLRLWLGRIPLVRAREIMQHVPPHEKGVMAFLLSLAADREENPIAKRVLELTCRKSLQVGIYSTLFQHYITQ